MTDGTPGNTGWFEGVEPGDVAAAAAAIREGSAERPRNWPAEAVETGFADDESAYYETLKEATIEAADAGVTEREQADDQQLIHAVRSMDDCERTANELAERVAEWAGTRFSEAGTGIEYARELATREPADTTERPLIGLARRVADLADEAAVLRRHVESTAPDIAPNLSALAGPVLAARLISLAGGLESLAKKPSGTVQVLGAEDALFAHLQGSAPSPKHGVIYTHEYVSGTDPDERGSAARALAGKLTIAARIDHYSGDRRPELDAELDERIATIRSRGEQ
ncbi:NOP5/NOP56 family protein [Halorhabdus amylolytica]|uniref:NOP5/NOP56 family protein n=1 Tax=Halorhabdus amylolytica TaxID=2559573 RepID=UPI0010A9E530|nr:NOP5/NOP56 family protein [Halorhabdus amylolytica]